MILSFVHFFCPCHEPSIVAPVSALLNHVALICSNVGVSCSTHHVAGIGRHPCVTLANHLRVCVVFFAALAQENCCFDACPTYFYRWCCRICYVLGCEQRTFAEQVFASSSTQDWGVFNVHFLVDVQLG